MPSTSYRIGGMTMRAKWYRRSLILPLVALFVTVGCAGGSTPNAGSVKVMAEWASTEQTNFLSVLKPFDDMLTLQSQIKGTGVTPWCVALKSGGADDGWPGSDWLKEIVLSQSGPDVYDKWVAGTQKWSSPEIKSAFQTWGKVLGSGDDSNVFGGSKGITNTSFKTGGNPLFATPPKCYLHNQASFITTFFQEANPKLQPVTDFNFFPLPDITSSFDVA